MTPEEVEQSLNKMIKVAAPGKVKGWKYAKITDFDPNKNTPWGKGTMVITYPLEQDQYHQRFRTFRCCITQIDLYVGNPRKRKKKVAKTGKRVRKSNGDDTPKRKRVRKVQEEPIKESKRRKDDVIKKRKRKKQSASKKDS